MLSAIAPAKLNLSLEITDRREDGFHDLVSVMQTISLVDELQFRLAPTVRLRCDDPRLEGPDNLVVRAAELLLKQREGSPMEGCEITLVKQIPLAAGLGGGSSDGATTLIALSRLWTLPTSCQALLPLAAALGSDVPFFLTAGTALVRGRGERVDPLPSIRPTWFVLAKPHIDVSTARIFGALPRQDWTEGSRTGELATTISKDHLPGIGVNGLQETLFALYPEARTCYEQLNDLVPGWTLVSGSGPTSFAVCSSEREARDVAAHLPPELWSAVAHSLDPIPGETPCRENPPHSS